ncbi:hypothetical protein CRM22_005696 [Opisthorchis felineus]|uniref:L-2-hydroxyglutarate dehydrogenase, mitochondrial n=1 Tax=Opisthorchis felineus TaxID=147828 RepID=A0A4S2LVX6_OPIFE|nr:hypothetical protein CRM22_005696 [Opisthorchis felineus]
MSMKLLRHLSSQSGEFTRGVLWSARAQYSSTADSFDIGIIGGGILGLATGRELLQRHPKLRLLVLEKEPELGAHQTGHNSGVIHAGIYYAPGSLKAKLCVEGMRRTYEYLDSRNIPYKKCGKLIVAVHERELPTLEDLMHRATINGCPDVALIPGSAIPSIEPHCRGLRAIHSPHTGIVDWRQVAISYSRDCQKMGGEIRTSLEVTEIKESSENCDFPIHIVARSTKKGETLTMQVQCRHLITCAGLQSDLVAKMTNCPSDPRIIPFRGDFLKLKSEYNHLVKGNIYPVPDPRFPFLGVHFTPRIDGSVLLGPNAVLALKREGYGLTDFNLKEALSILFYPGLQRIAWKYLNVGMSELLRAFITRLQVKKLQQYIPALKPENVERGPSGVRAQALNRKGELVEDFVIHSGDDAFGSRIIHVRNAPSPAATSSLAIARMLVDKAEEQFQFKKAAPT